MGQFLKIDLHFITPDIVPKCYNLRNGHMRLLKPKTVPGTKCILFIVSFST